MKKFLFIILLFPSILFSQYNSNNEGYNINGINFSDGYSFIRGNQIEYPLQLLKGNLASDGITLPDSSGNGYDGLLVNSNMALISGQYFDTVSTSPTTEGFAMYNYSVEFVIKPMTAVNGNRVVLGRLNTAVTGYALVSAIHIVNGVLYYYSTNGVSAFSTVNLGAVVVGTTYTCRIRINSSRGSLSWTINGVDGRSAYTNYTPATAIENDKFHLFTNHSKGWNYLGYAYDIKIYNDTNYSNLVHWYPCAEGNGKILYDVVGGKHDTTTTAFTSSTQNSLHYNWRYGFELYGNDTNIIRVPYLVNGTKISPTIENYTFYADCPSGNHNNFSETGIKRNPTNLDTLADLGIDSSNIVYFMGVDGNDSLSFCSNFGTKRETNWCIYKSKKDRKTTFNMPMATKYFRAGVSLKKLVSSDSIRHHNSVKLANTNNYDVFIKNGTYNENRITLAKNVCLIGESRAGTIIRGYQDSTVNPSYYYNYSTMDWGDSTAWLCNLTVTAENLRYTIHADGQTKVHQRYLYNCDIIHYGNLTAESYNDSVTIIPKDAWGSGTYPGTYTYAEDCKFYGYSRGFAQHGSLGYPTSENRTITIFKNCEFKNTGVNDNSSWNYCLRFNPEVSIGKDSLVFINCNYNNQSAYFDRNSTYTTLADKVSITNKPTFMVAYTRGWEALRFTGTEGVIGVTEGTTTTLLMGTVYTNTDSNFCYGNKNITDYVLMIGYKSLGYYLGDCSGVNKTMEITVDGSPQTITFDEDFTARDNAYVLAFINNQISGAVASIYEYLTHL